MRFTESPTSSHYVDHIQRILSKKKKFVIDKILCEQPQPQIIKECTMHHVSQSAKCIFSSGNITNTNNNNTIGSNSGKISF